MSIEFTDPLRGLITFDQGLPAGYRGALIPGSQFLHARYDFGTLLVQELQGDGFSFRYSIYQFLERISLQSRSLKEGLYARLQLKSPIRHKVKGAGTLLIKEGQYSVLWSRVAECYCRFEQKEYQTLDLYFSPELISQLSDFFPELQSLMELEPKHPVFIGSKIRWMPAKLHSMVREMLECHFDPPTSHFYFEHKVRELLLLLLDDCYNGKEYPVIKLSAADQERLEGVRKILLEHLNKKLPSIREISRQVALNEFKIKKGFRQLFGMTIMEFLLEARMEKARELLMSTDLPIKFICAQAGYPRLSNFITAFRRRYGYTPGSLRRK